MVHKTREPKAYRHRVIDEELRTARTRAEARLLREARSLGVAVPLVYDVDLAASRLTMEFVEGPTVKEVLATGSLDAATDLCRQVGALAATLHAGDLIHGDLTTSNLILRGETLVLVDLGLGERRSEVEAKGVDLHLLREAFLSAHADRAELLSAVLEGYRASYADADAVLAKAEQIERRARYTRGS